LRSLSSDDLKIDSSLRMAILNLEQGALKFLKFLKFLKILKILKILNIHMHANIGTHVSLTLIYL